LAAGAWATTADRQEQSPLSPQNISPQENTMATDTVWYENVEQGTLHEVVRGSALEKRLRRDQREIYEDGEDEPTFETAYRRLTDAEVKKAQANPEKVPGYPTAHAARRAAAEAEKQRQAARDEALTQIIIQNAAPAVSDPKADA